MKWLITALCVDLTITRKSDGTIEDSHIDEEYHHTFISAENPVIWLGKRWADRDEFIASHITGSQTRRTVIALIYSIQVPQGPEGKQAVAYIEENAIR